MAVLLHCAKVLRAQARCVANPVPISATLTSFSRRCWLRRLMQQLDRFDHLLIMPIHLDALPELGDLAIAVDEESRALDAEEFLAVHIPFAPRAVAFGDFMIGVGQQRK